MSVYIDVARVTDYPPARPPGVYAYVYHDWERSPYVPRSLYDPNDKLDNTKGYPEMCPLDPRDGVRLTERLQWFWFAQLQLSAGYSMTPDELKNAWRGLTKGGTAFTNGKGTNDGWDYINKWNEGAELPQLFENTCGGHTLELFDTIKRSNGKYKVKTLRTSDYEIWKNWTYKSHPQYFTLATNATVVQYGDKWKVDPMHYLGGKDVPVPLMSETGYAYIDPARVRILADDEPTPRAYYP